MIYQLYRHRKLIFASIIVLGVATFVVTNIHFPNHVDVSDKVGTFTGLSYIKDSAVIDKELVIKSLKGTQQLVGMEGHATKTYIYTDSIFKEHGWLKDAIGQRTLEVDVHALFKTGINLSDISQDDIVAYGNTLWVKIPKQALISLDVPFDQMVFTAKNGLMRAELSMEEKQMLYTEIRKIITNNIMSDEAVKNSTYDGVKNALQHLLEKIPNCSKIVFTRKGE